jgi:uncharacterized phage protein gp47/JayE
MLDKNGFQRKTYDDLLTEVSDRFRQLFGDNINLTARGFFGILAMIFAWFLSIAWQLAEKVYDSAYPTRAEGVQLDRLTPFFNTSRQLERSAVHELAFTGTPNYTILADTAFETSSGVMFSLMDDVLLDGSGSGTGYAICTVTGTVGNVATGTITIQSEPSADILTVTNTLLEEAGQDYEEDTTLQNRLLNSGASNGSGTVNAILADVLALGGVRAATVTVNNTDAAVNGQPAHSNQVFVFGGVGQEIANALMENFTGIQLYGTSSFTVTDIAGNTHNVAYTPAATVDIFSTITITTDATFQADGSDQVKDAVSDVINGLNMGDDVIISRILATVMNIQGVTDVSVTIGTVLETQGATNIAINTNEVAQTDTSKISVVVS